MKIKCEFYDTKRTKIKAKYATTDDGKSFVGAFEEFYPNGKTKHRCFYEDGVLHGQDDRYTPEGKLFQSITYTHGKREIGSIAPSIIIGTLVLAGILLKCFGDSKEIHQSHSSNTNIGVQQMTNSVLMRQ